MTNEQIQAVYQIGGAAGIIVAAAFVGIQWVIRTVKAMDLTTVKTQKTTIITSDTISMDRLTQTIEASNVVLTENNILRREEHADRAAMREAIEENTKAIEHCTGQISEARRDIKDLAFQMARAGK